MFRILINVSVELLSLQIRKYHISSTKTYFFRTRDINSEQNFFTSEKNLLISISDYTKFSIQRIKSPKAIFVC